MKFIRVLVLILLPFNGFSQLVGKVVRVADGDTFTMLVEGNKKVKVRLYGIDCPEMKQEYGETAMQHLTVLIGFHHDSVRVIKKGKDKYGRIVGIAFTGKTNINERMLEKGLAWHYTTYDQNPKWSLMEEGARHAGFNVWSNPKPVPPWEWRKKNSKKK